MSRRTSLTVSMFIFNEIIISYDVHMYTDAYLKYSFLRGGDDAGLSISSPAVEVICSRNILVDDDDELDDGGNLDPVNSVCRISLGISLK